MDETMGRNPYLQLFVVLSLIGGTILFTIGVAAGDTSLIAIGVLWPLGAILFYLPYVMTETGTDGTWVIEPSATRYVGEGPSPSQEATLDDGPGICQTCGGALHYGRLHCPHCSESIFQGAGDEDRPPEF